MSLCAAILLSNWPHFTAFQIQHHLFICLLLWAHLGFQLIKMKNKVFMNAPRVLFSSGHRKSSGVKKQLASALGGFSKQSRRSLGLFNEQSIIYFQFKHLRPWMKMKAAEKQNVKENKLSECSDSVWQEFPVGTLQLFTPVVIEASLPQPAAVTPFHRGRLLNWITERSGSGELAMTNVSNVPCDDDCFRLCDERPVNHIAVKKRFRQIQRVIGELQFYILDAVRI